MEMQQPQIPSAVLARIYSGIRTPTSDSVYQIAIVLAAFLLVITASLF